MRTSSQEYVKEAETAKENGKDINKLLVASQMMVHIANHIVHQDAANGLTFKTIDDVSDAVGVLKMLEVYDDVKDIFNEGITKYNHKLPLVHGILAEYNDSAYLHTSNKLRKLLRLLEEAEYLYLEYVYYLLYEKTVDALKLANFGIIGTVSAESYEVHIVSRIFSSNVTIFEELASNKNVDISTLAKWALKQLHDGAKEFNTYILAPDAKILQPEITKLIDGFSITDAELLETYKRCMELLRSKLAANPIDNESEVYNKLECVSNILSESIDMIDANNPHIPVNNVMKEYPVIKSLLDEVNQAIETFDNSITEF